MSQVMNDPNGLQNIYSMLGPIITSGINNLGIAIQFIEEAKSSGNFEPENYEQLMSSEYLGGEFQQEYYSAYQEQIPKMQQFLSELEQKLNEYLQIS